MSSKPVYETNPAMATIRARIQGFLDYVEPGGNFPLRALYEALGARTPEEQSAVRQGLSRERKSKSVEPTSKYGEWRRVDLSIEVLDLSVIGSDEQEPLHVKLLGLENLIRFHHGGLIIIAGRTNTGKTASALGFAHEYRGNLPLNYYSSEVTREQVQERAQRDGIPLDSLKGIRFAMRFDNYQDIVSENGIHIIDYLAAPLAGDDPAYFKIPHLIAKIHEKLNGTGLLFILLQKDPGKMSGEGGFKTLHRANLYLTLDKDESGHCWANVQKCKTRSTLEGYRMQYEPRAFGLRPLSEWIPRKR